MCKEIKKETQEKLDVVESAFDMYDELSSEQKDAFDKSIKHREKVFELVGPFV